ncbi:NPCBM/NEW2 domain-containing protein [Deinococcus yavapaiensis]|uniref:NPCBM/NEW2 domain-containing protein n=1 Tax=Deinococcus yavapaiensis KR-236 TaxID=694435 RepID=A0A318SA56_9DEIO|nr:NPCBM/NEW2 domain-containing protein [Deinococcus yavapaiensis]PYE55759.1 NPCBM/NEW2 domain-containing protein [Deinococcus yavapaiensis KR-236]
MSLFPARARLLPSLGLAVLTLTLAACGQQGVPSAPIAKTPTATIDSVYDGTDRSWALAAPEARVVDKTVRAQLVNGNSDLSAEPFVTATNGWGPVERDKSNGEWAAGDGRVLTIGGQTFAKGIGTHAGSTVTFNLGAKCTTFTGGVGIDDEVGSLGSAVFQIYGNGVKLYDSGVVRGTDLVKTFSVNVSGVNELKLVVTDAGDGVNYDHADWVNTVLGNCNVTPSTTIQYSGPIVIKQGGTYTGNWESLNPDVPAVSVQTDQPVTIVNSNIRGRGDLIRGWWMDLTVRNTNGYGLNPNRYDLHAGRFVAAENLKNLVLENNLLDNTGGIYINVFNGSAAAGQTVKILRNKVKNINGRKSDGANGYLNTGYYLQFVQMSKVRDIANAEIGWNEVINEPNKSFLEENINLYATSGTAASPIRIHDNFIKGAYAINPSTNTQYSGGGILVGDGSMDGPGSVGAYVDVYRNQVVSTSNQAYAISGGHDHRFFENRAVSSGRLPDGSIIAAQNVGAYVWDAMNGAGVGIWYNNTLRDNLIGWTRINSAGTTWFNNYWLPSCTTALCYNNQNWSGAVTLDTEAQEYQVWLNKLTQNGVAVGPR